ncbi:MAG TPA: nuclear transport factor 2 family protein [Thermomicrobiales bacterium]|nr:nuclear transport factor 2 family protein [Thermomicrobiales bacterium]
MPIGATGEDVGAIARAWLAEMQACVRTEDYARCRAIFADDVVAFGTRAALVVGLEALERDQWRHIWGAIRGFAFLMTDVHCRGYGDAGIWVACPWTSEGRGPDGEWRERLGRMTAVLERRGERWLAVHTHHSLVPR